MSATDWGILIPAVVGCLGALTAWLRAEAAASALRAHLKDEHAPPSG